MFIRAGVCVYVCFPCIFFLFCFFFCSFLLCFISVCLFVCLFTGLFVSKKRKKEWSWVGGELESGRREGGKTDQICCRKNLISIKGAYFTHRLKSIIEGSEDRSLKQKLWRNLLACSCLTSISLQHRTTCPGNNAAHNGFIKPC